MTSLGNRGAAMQQSLQSLCKKKSRRVIGISCELKFLPGVKADGAGVEIIELPG